MFNEHMIESSVRWWIVAGVWKMQWNQSTNLQICVKRLFLDTAWTTLKVI